MPILTVSETTHYLKGTLDKDPLLNDLWVSGEISNFTRSAVGHLYFTLKDSDNQIKCVMFRGGSGGESLDSGLAVVAHGRVSIYETRGELQLYVDLVRQEGLGERYLELERLKARLENDGLFDLSRKRPIPRFPQCIGVVTSAAGAVWHDIQSIISRRYPLVELILAPCQVQGEHATLSIQDALQALRYEDRVDTIILARGGGALEELWPFNDEGLARTIYSSHRPVISAIGHETDVTIADLVADLRAPTPSAAAELAVPDAQELKGTVSHIGHSLFDQMAGWISSHEAGLNRLRDRVGKNTPNFFSHRQVIDELLEGISAKLKISFEFRHQQMTSLEHHLDSLNPKATLDRGFAIIQDQSTNHIIDSLGQVSTGQFINVNLKDGNFDAQVVGKPQSNFASPMNHSVDLDNDPSRS